MLLEGLQLPLTTPFYADGRLNLHKLVHNVERYSLTPVAGLAALSDSGEPSLLSDEETRQTLRCVAEAAAEEKVLIAGVSRDSLVGTLDIAEYAATLGYDAVLVKPPSVLSYNGYREASPKALLTYFQALADRSPLPVVLYSTTSRPGAALPTEMIADLAGHPRIIGLVDDAVERVTSLKAATASIKREVNVTSIFAAVTSRMRIASDASTSDGRAGLISA